MNQKVVVIGWGFTSRLCLIRSLAQVGCEISIVVIEGKSRLKPVDAYSRYVKHVYYHKPGEGEEGLVKLLLDNCVDENGKVLLIPNNDFSTSALDKHLNLLSKYFILPHINNQEGAIVEWMNKEKQKHLAEEVGMSVAKSRNVDICEHEYKMPVMVEFPCFTKTRAYTPGYKNTLHRCDNEKELKEVLDTLSHSHKNLTIMIEDYKDIEREYAVVGFSNGDVVIIPGILEILSMAQGSDKGVACMGRISPINDFSQLVEKFKIFIRTIGFIGLFDIDFYLSKGVYYFGELNLRIGGSGYAVMKQGVNLPGMYVKSILGESISGMNLDVVSTSTYVNERICSDNWYEGFLSTKEFCHMLRSATISFVKDEKDRMPGYAFKCYLMILYAKRLLRRWRKRKMN